MGFKRSDDLVGAVYFPSKTKKEVLKKYKGQVVRLIEKMHCILIYYAIKDHLDGVKEIIICQDVNYRRLKSLIPLLFKDSILGIDVRAKSESKKSNGHGPAIRAFRKRMGAEKVKWALE